MHSEITTTTLTISFIIITSFCGVFATLYTRCNNLTGVGYQHEALFSDICETLIEATAQCLNNSLCDLISKNGSQCSFHTAINRNVTCGTGGVISIGDVSIDRFRSCNCLCKYKSSCHKPTNNMYGSGQRMLAIAIIILSRLCSTIATEQHHHTCILYN